MRSRQFNLTLLHAAWLVSLLGLGAMNVAFGNESAEQLELDSRARTLLTSRCFVCHGPDDGQRQGGFRLDDRQSYLSPAESGTSPIALGDRWEDSAVWQRINTEDDSLRMPPPEFGPALADEQLELISAWIQSGANLPKHWSFVPPSRPEVPHGPNSPLARQWAQPIDRFVLIEQLSHGLEHSPEARRAELLRRVALDLTGLPPTLEELSAFESDAEPEAYERQVDRLLASPSFGEHWARKWLDLARYADSAGYADDPNRTIWAYRDWVIRAINSNMPIDQFTIEQLAGDLLPNPTSEQLVATAFHRNTLTNNEGGTNDEEFRNVAVVDRVNTTMSVWMGITFSCAQCHTHKYDPFTQHEYYQLFAIFNQSADVDRADESPTIDVYSRAEVERVELAARSWIELKNKEGRLGALLQELAEVKPMTTVPVMRELDPSRRRITHVHIRGDYKSLGDLVEPGTPAVFHSIRSANANRLDLAHWLVDPSNPLTARVWANRIWESLFGAGIVRTSEEFGAQGDAPTHPLLLDWLATEFVSLDWDFKALVREIVTSHTYRQSSRASAEQLERDPDNVWLARGPRVRLSAETIRDMALRTAGLLAGPMYGPPVLPPQPNLGLKAAFGGDTDWKPSEGEDRYRRGIYTKWRRSNPYPSMATFDAPSREVCILRRESTNTPLQALVTLNDPAFVEAAQALARRIVLYETPTSGDVRTSELVDQQRMVSAFRLCTSRLPEAHESSALLDLLATSRTHFAQRNEAAVQLATDPLGPLPAEVDAVELAAWTSVCNVLLNLDEVLMKR